MCGVLKPQARAPMCAVLKFSLEPHVWSSQTQSRAPMCVVLKRI